jgi:hypothetical protein
MRITLLGIVVVIALSLMLMPALVRTPEAVQQPPPGSDPALPH